MFLGRDPAVFCSIDQAKAKKKSIVMVLTRSDGARPRDLLLEVVHLCLKFAHMEMKSTESVAC